jgi:hypothetical protein
MSAPSYLIFSHAKLAPDDSVTRITAAVSNSDNIVRPVA